jgi:tetratricopeptide (TPR) repeat protein
MPTVTAYNKPHLEQLGKILKAGGGAGLIGAGTSMACGYPGWNQFLKALEEPLHHRLSAEYLKQLQQRNTLTRLDKMVEVLGDDYPRIFRETFQPRGDGQKTPEWIRLLFDLNLRLLLTTNYTTELEEAARFHPSTPLGENPMPVRWHKVDELDAAIRRTPGRLQLIYLHGRWDDSPIKRLDAHDIPWSYVILGETSYKYAYGHPGRVSHALDTVCGSHTLLIVGASLADEDIKHVLREGRARVGPGAAPHYVVAPLWPNQDLELTAQEWRDRFGLQAIFYEVLVGADGKDDHGRLEELLRELVRRASQVAPPSRSDEMPASVAGRMPTPRIVHPLLRATDFQPRPLYQQPLEEFIRRDPSGGVLALIGIGGSGKTALVREALATLQTHHQQVGLDGIFVWSFYDEPDPAAFMRSLAGYVSSQEPPTDWTEVRAYEVIRQRCAPGTRLLLILDGLEKLQLERPDDRRVHGSLESPTLRRLLLWLAQEPVAARALVTTRFPLRDLESETADGRVVLLDLDALTRPQARALLRRRGVEKGTERDLDVLLDHFGAHALTVDHLGGVIHAYLEGDPTRFRELGQGPLTRFEAGQSGKRLSRILAAYQGYLERDEPEVRATLERVVIFPRPVGVGLLAEVFLDPARASRAGRLQGKSEMQLRAYLRRLVELHFLREERIRNEVLYSIHPALRDAVLESLGKERVSLAAAAQESMEHRLLTIKGRPGLPPEAPSARDLIEDLIGFCLDAGHDTRAFELYRRRMGGYEGIGWKLGDYTRGERLARRLLEGALLKQGVTRERAFLLLDLAMALETLGRLTEALGVYQEDLAHLEQNLPQELNLIGMATRSKALAQLVAGELVTATRVAEQALRVATTTKNEWLLRDSVSTRAAIRGARGRIAEAFADFTSARHWQNQGEGGDAPLYSLRGFHLQVLLMQVGRPVEALTLARASLALNLQHNWQDSILRSQLVEVEALRQTMELAVAQEHWEHVCQRVMNTDYLELFAWSRLFGSRLMRDLGERERARREAEEGLRTAETCGFGLLSIDFYNMLARLFLETGEHGRALELASLAHTRAVNPDCDYFWGQLNAHELLAQVHRRRGELALESRHAQMALDLRERVTVTDDMVRQLLPPGPPGFLKLFGKNFERFQRRSKQGEAKANLMAIKTTFRAFLQEKDRYPTSFAEAGVSLETGARYVYLLSPHDVLGGDGSSNRELLIQRAWTILETLGMTPRAEPSSFLIVAVTDFDSGVDLDVWSIDDQSGVPINVLTRDP